MWQEAQGMITLYRTDDRILSEIQEYGPGAWIVMTKPTIDESKSIAERFEIDLADVRAALELTCSGGGQLHTDNRGYSFYRDKK